MAAVEPDIHRGRCHCGAVQYQAQGLENIWYCHCTQCRSLTGHFMAACRALTENVRVNGTIKWTPVSEHSEHGFCGDCCSPLFWRNKTKPTMSIVAGSLASTHGLECRGHIFVSEKGAYYEISDGLPQFDTFPDGGV